MKFTRYDMGLIAFCGTLLMTFTVLSAYLASLLAQPAPTLEADPVVAETPVDPALEPVLVDTTGTVPSPPQGPIGGPQPAPVEPQEAAPVEPQEPAPVVQPAPVVKPAPVAKRVPQQAPRGNMGWGW